MSVGSRQRCCTADSVSASPTAARTPETEGGATGRVHDTDGNRDSDGKPDRDTEGDRNSDSATDSGHYHTSDDRLRL